MNLKLVVRNREDGGYKLKNKKEEGDTVMRRQTWHEEGAPVGRDFEWRKHEYKLVKRVNYYRQMPDGTHLPTLYLCCRSGAINALGAFSLHLLLPIG